MPGDLPEGGDERLQNMEQVVLKPQNRPEQFHLLANSPPTRGLPSISDFITKAYQTDRLPGEMREAIQRNSGLQEITVAECTEENGLVRLRGSWYVLDCDELRLHIIQEHHDTALARNPGQAKTFDLLDRGYDWKDMGKDNERYVQNCHDCQRSRNSRRTSLGVRRSLHVPDERWEDCSMDFVVGLPECEGFNAIWVVVDRLSKMRHFIPCHTIIDTLGLAVLFMKEVVRLHGLPLSIVSDRGPQFASTFWEQVCSEFGIDWRMSTAFHPQTDGQTERMNASKEQYLWAFPNHQQDDWVRWLLLAEFAANNAVSETTKCIPFYVIRGTDPRMSFVGEPTQQPDQQCVSANKVQATMQQIHEHLRVEMRRSQAVQEDGANHGQISAPNIQEGSEVWLHA